jgi:hypothetical protein
MRDAPIVSEFSNVISLDMQMETEFFDKLASFVSRTVSIYKVLHDIAARL